MEKFQDREWLKIAGLSLLGLLFVAGVVFAGYKLGQRQAQPKIVGKPTPAPTLQPEITRPPDETANWKTYADTELRFSVDYPQEWIAREFSREVSRIGKSTGIFFRPDDPRIEKSEWGLVTIEVEENKEGLNVDDFIDNYLCDAPGICPSSKTSIPMIISGVPGKRVINPPAPVPSQIIVVINAHKIFTLNVILDTSLEDLYSVQDKEKLFNLMLSTFRFLE